MKSLGNLCTMIIEKKPKVAYTLPLIVFEDMTTSDTEKLSESMFMDIPHIFKSLFTEVTLFNEMYHDSLNFYLES